MQQGRVALTKMRYVAILCIFALVITPGCSSPTKGSDRNSEAESRIAGVLSGKKPLDCYTLADCAKACDQKVPGACARLYNLHSAPWSKTKNQQAALAATVKGCEQGDSRSCLSVYLCCTCSIQSSSVMRR